MSVIVASPADAPMIVSAESDRRSQIWMEALNRSQEQSQRRLFAIAPRIEGLDLRADMLEEHLSRIMRRFKIRQYGPE